MLRKLEKLRTQPKDVRNRYAFWYAFLFTAVIAVFWLSTMPARVGVLSTNEPQREKEAGGFARMWNNMKASVMDAPELLPAPEETLEVQEVTPISMDSFMTSSTASQPKKTARPILIGTSSVKKASTSDR
jgi:hypothetical protein